MSWMLTATGAALDLHYVGRNEISLLDIAHHLAQTNRYNGACSRPYSVAEHSLLTCEIVERQLGVRDPAVLQAALMHDAHEAYTGDMTQSVKLALRKVAGDAWDRFEERLQRHVLHRFDLLTQYISAEQSIHWADMTALATERVQLMPAGGPAWEVLATHDPVDWADLKAHGRFTWQDWRQAFLDRFADLDFARQLKAGAIGV